jgi:GNAT superfamily N-acetyltransferase
LLTVKRADLSDAAQIAAIIAAAFAEYRGRLVPESAALDETGESIGGELAAGSVGFLADWQGRAVGCVMAKAAGDSLYFGRLSVLREGRGHGAGLVEAVEIEALRRGLRAASLNVRIALPENQRFFAGLGYVETGREAHPGFAEPTFINMRKALAGRAG